MRKHAQQDWNIPETTDGRVASWDYVPMAVLMDIRDHLRAIRTVFECHNATRIPGILDQIQANTRKPTRKRKAR